MEPAQSLIRRPPRSSLAGAVLILAAIGILTSNGPLPGTVAAWLPLPLAVLLILGHGTRQAQTVHVALFGLLYYAGSGLAGRWWPLPHVITLASYGLLVRALPWLRSSAGWFRRGRIGRRDIALIAGFSVASAIALIIWRFTTRADLSQFRALVPDAPLGAILAGMVGVALLNAALEETMWRGVIMHALSSALPSRWAVWLVQAACFGIWHYRGFPSGWVGVGLATVFAAMMGVLRTSSRGMLAPFIAHALADLTIFAMVAHLALAGSP